RQAQNRVHNIQTLLTTHHVREPRGRKRLVISSRVYFLQFMLRQAVAMTRAKDQLPQVKHQIAIRSEISDRWSRRSLTIYKLQSVWLAHKRLHFATCEPLPLVH